MELRDRIVSEIQRLAKANGGTPPGRAKFEQETGIKYSHWSGIIWARWGDALAEAGFKPNTFSARHNTEVLFSMLVDAVRHYGKLPTFAELKLYRNRVPAFPTEKTIGKHFGARAGMLSVLRERATNDPAYADIIGFLPERDPAADEELHPLEATNATREGWVYLIKSGDHYKVGRGENLERRVKEIRIALPEAGTLVHAIRTDDAAGIEAYWHRRFAPLRANGEWFRLSHADVTAFKRRKFQ